MWVCWRPTQRKTIIIIICVYEIALGWIKGSDYLYAVTGKWSLGRFEMCNSSVQAIYQTMTDIIVFKNRKK